ncbi:ABC-three component system middle component 6 [Enterococcus cecorum]|uniref:ABC-three component system middle component 6 n=1 Tax=Enterococcus cecorum TaxID=44008 RepID=UPI00148C7DFB|nr:ABC-three component system middle component 6 [Enterococcus cecorum]MCJ0593402.1 hypothetical protein [Enterococcus cecorum]
MFLPKKQLSLYESYFGFGAFLLRKISKINRIEDLWEEYLLCYKNREYPVKFTFNQFVVTLDYLFMIQAIRLNEEGEIVYETH